MNSIVERLRNPFHMHDSPTMREAADLIEQQAERIKELEAYNATRTDEMIAATRRIKELEAYTKSLETSRGELVETQAEKITEQRKRIKELEAELGAGHLQCIADRQKYKQELAALRKKIEEAPRYGTDMDMIYVEDLQK